MRKILTTLSFATALFAGQTMADQATLNALQAYDVPLPAKQSSAIAQLVAAQPVMAATIVAATMRSNPSLADAIAAAAIEAVPDQEQASNQ